MARVLPERALSTHRQRPFLIAKFDPSRALTAGPQVIIDYVSLTGFVTNQLFLSDQTYAINSLNLYGSNVLLGGTILKFYSNASITLPSGSLVSLAPAFQQAVLTCVDDHSYGENFGTGNPSGYYANPALNFQSLGTVSLANLRFAYAKQAIAASSTTLDLPHAQFIKCQQGASLSGGRLNLRNALFANCVTNFNIQSPTTIDAQNVTFSGSAYLATAAGSGSTVTLTNCILANVTNLNSSYPALSGDCNGFYNSPTFGATIYTAASYPFRTVGGASYYFAEDSPFRSGASTNINATLQTDLRRRTVWPPIVFSNAE